MNTGMHPGKLLITEKELAAMLSVSWRHVQNLRNRRLIPHVRLGRVVRMCNERRANYLLDVGPDRSGRIPDTFVNRMKEIGSLIDARHPE